MRTAASTIGLLCGAIGLITLAATPAPAQLDRGLTPPPCSVLSGHPCHPSFCSVFHHGPCFPQHLPPIGQDLRLTIAAAEEKPKDKPVTDRTPMHFTRGMAGAIAGRPIILHFFDNRIVPGHFSQAGDPSK